jgi:hypothetical protein
MMGEEPDHVGHVDAAIPGIPTGEISPEDSDTKDYWSGSVNERRRAVTRAAGRVTEKAAGPPGTSPRSGRLSIPRTTGSSTGPWTRGRLGFARLAMRMLPAARAILPGGDLRDGGRPRLADGIAAASTAPESRRRESGGER